MKTWELSETAAYKWMGAFVLAQWLSIPLQGRTAIATLLSFMVMDFITGIWAAALEGQISSVAGFRGLSKKVGIVLILLYSHRVEDLIHMELNVEFVGALGFTVNEVISTIENFARIGVPIPKALLNALLQAKSLRLKAATPEEIKALEEDREL